VTWACERFCVSDKTILRTSETHFSPVLSNFFTVEILLFLIPGQENCRFTLHREVEIEIQIQSSSRLRNVVFLQNEESNIVTLTAWKVLMHQFTMNREVLDSDQRAWIGCMGFWLEIQMICQSF
jgi:hypothetical protein